MRRLILFVLLATSRMFGIEASEIIDRMVERYRNMNSFYAEFEQVYCDEEAGICQRFEGRTYYMRPNFFRMEIDEPKQIYVGDSVSLWIYMPEEKRAIRQKLQQMPFQVNPDALFENYQNDYNPVLSGESENYYEIVMEAKEETGMYQRLTVQIRKGTYEMTAISVMDDTGSESKFEFTKVEINKKIPKKLFEFTPAKGVQVEEY
ncbi:outer membrane lipoprotein carrier protein LolA [candidate division WOR-3 bacterium]|nr:outer membrane lipoprotein carrier protein LolA [candidate division WOR-3 bacterium]